MAMTAYMKVTGNTQGPINGDCPQKGRENTVLVYELDHIVEIPRDTHTGLPTGQRIHKPLRITTHFGMHSPKFCQACCSGEQVQVEIDFYWITDKGQEQHYFTIKLTNAIIVEERMWYPYTFLEENKPYHHMQDVTFTYEKIVWTYEVTGIEGEDDWKAPKA